MGCSNSKSTTSDADSHVDKTLLMQENEANADRNSEKEVAKRRQLLEDLAIKCFTANHADIVAAFTGLSLGDSRKLQDVYGPSKPKPLDQQEFSSNCLSGKSLSDKLSQDISNLKFLLAFELKAESFRGQALEAIEEANFRGFLDVDEAPLRTTADRKEDAIAQLPMSLDTIAAI